LVSTELLLSKIEAVMKCEYLIGLTFIIPLLGMFFINLFANNLSSFIVLATNFVCLGVLFIAVLDVLFIAFKQRKANPSGN
jgi:hypothetical protein